MSSEKSKEVLRKTCGLFIILGLLGASPALADGVFVSAGGPYEGKVGDEIEFDASGSHMLDDSEIDGYYWDWDKDGRWDECFCSPKATHTWHSAFSGEVRLYIYYPGAVDWADAHVEIEGPETSMSITVSSNAELYLRDEMGRFLGLNPDTGLFDADIPGVTLTAISPTTVEDMSASGLAPTTAYGTRYDLPLVYGSTYDLTLTGVETGWFEMQVEGFEDSQRCSSVFRSDVIHEGETMTARVSACCQDGSLEITCGPLCYCPGMAVDPDDKIELTVQPGGRYETTITITETEGLRPLCGVTLTCSELTGSVDTIPASDINFNVNGFGVPAGGKQEVIMTVEVPEFFAGRVSGTITVACAGDNREEIDVIVRKAGLHAPTIQVESPVYGTVGAPVEFDATGSSDRDGGIEQYCWDWELTGEYECFDDPVCTHTWDRAFSGVVRLRVVDNDGHTAEQYVQVVITE